MSPHVGNFVTDLVEMAKAMETLPQVQRSLDTVTLERDNALETVQARELAIQQYKATIDDLQRKLREAEASRDDAELRFLELEERSKSFLKAAEEAFAGMAHSAQDLDQFMNPPKPEPVPQDQQGQPMPVNQPDASFVQSPEVGPSDPTAQSSAGDGHSPVTAEATPSAQPSADASLPEASHTEPDASKLYYGRRYINVPGFVSRQEWIDGGGTNEDYDWRPDSSIA